MNERGERQSKKDPTELRRVLAVTANRALSYGLHGFTNGPYAVTEKTLRTKDVNIIKRVNDPDRGLDGTGEGLRLKRYERSMAQFAPQYKLRLDPEAPVESEELEEGALLSLYLKLNDQDESHMKTPPFFGAGDRLRFSYFIPTQRLVGAGALALAQGSLNDVVKSGEAFVRWPRVVDPQLFRWPQPFTPKPSLPITEPIQLPQSHDTPESTDSSDRSAA